MCECTASWSINQEFYAHFSQQKQMISIHICLCKNHSRIVCVYVLFFFYLQESKFCIFLNRATDGTCNRLFVIDEPQWRVTLLHTLSKPSLTPANRGRERERKRARYSVSLNVTHEPFVLSLLGMEIDRWCCYHFNAAWTNTKHDSIQTRLMKIN